MPLSGVAFVSYIRKESGFANNEYVTAGIGVGLGRTRTDPTHLSGRRLKYKPGAYGRTGVLEAVLTGGVEIDVRNERIAADVEGELSDERRKRTAVL